MKKIITSASLLIYILFAQIYPVVHWHEQEHHGEVEFHLSIHPAELQTDLFENHQHHDSDRSHEHKHKDNHYDGDLDYLNQSKIQSLVVYKITTIISKTDNFESQVMDRIPLYIPIKIPDDRYAFSQPDRAPPLLS